MKKCRQQQDQLTDREASILAQGIIDECAGRGDQPSHTSRRLTRDLFRERLRARTTAPPDLLEVVF